MLDVGHIVTSSNNFDQRIFTAPSTTTLIQWDTWIKPRGVRMVHILAFGGGGSGGCGLNSAATSGGGPGGGSGAQTSVLIPASFIPDTLYIQCGAGGKQPAALVSAAAGVAGLNTYVAVEPFTTVNAGLTLALANGAAAAAAASAADHTCSRPSRTRRCGASSGGSFSRRSASLREKTALGSVAICSERSTSLMR